MFHKVLQDSLTGNKYSMIMVIAPQPELLWNTNDSSRVTPDRQVQTNSWILGPWSWVQITKTQVWRTPECNSWSDLRLRNCNLYGRNYLYIYETKLCVGFLAAYKNVSSSTCLIKKCYILVWCFLKSFYSKHLIKVKPSRRNCKLVFKEYCKYLM